MRLQQGLTWVLVLGFSIRIWADGLPDTTIFLNEVNINSNIVQNLSFGNKIQKLPSKTIQAYQNSNLLDILSNHAMVNIKSYGISGVTNISMRGSLTNQTAVLWNGINLQDPLNGSVNPALFPLGLVDEIEIQYGGSGSLYGSGAVGGVIMMKKKMDFNTGWGLDFSAGLGSFANYQGQFRIRYGGTKYSGSLLFYHLQGENDFEYVNNQIFGHPKLKQENAASETNGLSQDNSFILNENQKINTHLWYQKSHRQIAPNMTISGARQFQDDESFRLSSDWIKYGEKLTLMTRLAVLYSSLDYQDPAIDLQAKHESNSVIAQFESNYQLDKIQLINWGINNRFDVAKSDNFPDLTNRNVAALFLSYRLRLLQRKLNIVASLREELVDEKLGLPTPSLGLDWDLYSWLKFTSKISRNYRIPTFNDLYWRDGFAKGNPDLLAESGWSYEAGIQVQKDLGIYSPSIELNAFNSYINNLIVWLPESQVWQPVNKKEVWSRGIEIQQRNPFQFHEVNSGLDLCYTYNPTTINTGDNSGKQLIYSPINQFKVKYYFNYKNWTFDAIYQWYDKRYLSENNEKYLDPYSLVNLGIHGDFKLKKHRFGIQFRVNNLLNQVYQSVENYATPLRNFQISIQYKIN